MMNFAVLLGWLAVLAGLLLMAYFGQRWWSRDPNAARLRQVLAGIRTWESFVQDWDKPLKTLEQIVERHTPATMDAQLESTQSGQTLQTLGRVKETISKALTLTPQTQRGKGGPWVRKPNEEPSKVLQLPKEWILKIPGGERLPRAWFKGAAISSRSLKTLTDWFNGSKEDPGPARKFNRLVQEGTPVYFYCRDMPIASFKNLPPDFSGIRFQMVDLGAFKVTEGDCREMRQDDLLFTITAQEVEGEGRWLFYLDARGDFAKGSGMVLLMETFDPDVDVQMLL